MFKKEVLSPCQLLSGINSSFIGLFVYTMGCRVVHSGYLSCCLKFNSLFVQTSAPGSFLQAEVIAELVLSSSYNM